MIADRCNQYPLMTARSIRRIGRPFGLFHYYPSARRDQFEAAEQSKNFGAHIVLERSVDEDQIKRLVRPAEFAERPPYIRYDHARALSESELREIVANRGRGVAR